MLTRRDTTKLVLAGAALPLLPPSAAARSPEDWAQLLQRELQGHMVSGCDGKLSVTGFGMAKRGGRFQMVSVVRLDWSPGMRSRKFAASGPEEQAVFSQLLNQALFSFAKAWPGCVV